MITSSKYRGKGYGNCTQDVLCDAAKENGITAIKKLSKCFSDCQPVRFSKYKPAAKCKSPGSRISDLKSALNYMFRELFYP